MNQHEGMTHSDRELEAMREILDVLGHLDKEAQRRVASWVHERIVGDVLTSVVADVVHESVKSDRNVGNVTRTLAEATARELAKLYEQLMEVYASAFVDTATGGSLDCVAGIAGVERVKEAERVKDVDPLAQATADETADETDDELRKRVKAALHRSARHPSRS
ncbi:MAG TPA: hypothetical protein VIM47_00695 [Dermatophilaceae bacterium]